MGDALRFVLTLYPANKLLILNCHTINFRGSRIMKRSKVRPNERYWYEKRSSTFTRLADRVRQKTMIHFLLLWINSNILKRPSIQDLLL